MSWTIVTEDMANWLRQKGATVRFIAASNKWYAYI